VAGLEGGAVLAQSSTFELHGGTVSGNSAGEFGGALFLYDTVSTVVDTSLTANHCAAGWGGAAYVYYGSVELVDSGLGANVAQNAGALRLRDTSAQISGCDIHDNDVTDYAGGIFLSFSTLDLADSAIYDNRCAGGTDPYGGGLFCWESGQVTCSGSSAVAAGFWGNRATAGGGALLNEDSCSLVSDRCDWGGGADDNSPEDVYTWSSSRSWGGWGDDASFTCKAGSCG
jgi:hypothetical protein